MTFHQLVIWLLSFVLPFPFKPWNLHANSYGMPSVLALAFWAGVWAIPLCLIVRSMPRLRAWAVGAVLGGVVPSLWGFTVLAAIKGQPLFAKGNLGLIAIVLFINAVWGLGTVVVYRWLQRRYGSGPVVGAMAPT
ncbi:MAG: hypothetical protein M3Y32_02065 [Pseudomonadota bacterium]|nr:hypothetical protein [Pseudomonadota bacterium]